MTRQANVAAVFNVVAEQAPTSRRTIMQQTGLSKPTVLRIVGALEAEGLIRRSTAAPPTKRGAGRTPVTYELNPEAAYVIGVDIGDRDISAGLADLQGTTKAEISRELTVADRNDPVDALNAIIHSLIDSAGVPLTQVTAATIGIEQPAATTSAAAAEDTAAAMGSQLRSGLSLPAQVEIEDRYDLAALAEFDSGPARRASSFILITLGRSVGVGHVVDGHLRHHRRGGPGALAHLPVGHDRGVTAALTSDTGLDDPGATGSGPDVVTFGWAGSTDGLLAMMAQVLGTAANGTDLPAGYDSPNAIYQAAGNGDQQAQRAVDSQADLVARALAAITCTLDPDLVVLGGEIGGQPLLVTGVSRLIETLVPWPIAIEASTLNGRAAMIGAVNHARRAVPRLEAPAVSARVRSKGRAD